MNQESLFKYNIESICCVIDSLNRSTGETIKVRIHSFVNLLANDPFLGAAFRGIFELRPYFRLSMKIDDLFPSIDLPEEPVAQIIFVLNLMHDSVTRPRYSIFDVIFKLYGSGNGTADFVRHVFREPLELLKVRLRELSLFPWAEIKRDTSEILFPSTAYRFLTPDSLPEEECINKDRILYRLQQAHLTKEEIASMDKDFDLFVSNHNSYRPDIFFVKGFLARLVKYGGRPALSVIFDLCNNTILLSHIVDADPAVHPVKKRGRKPNPPKPKPGSQQTLPF